MIRTDDVALLASKAMLGGLLLDPAHVGQVNGWLRAQDLVDPWHRRVWTLIREAYAEGTTLDAIGLGGRMLERHGPKMAELWRIHDLLAAVPKDPDARPHARILVDLGVRREIAGQGVLIEASALAAATNTEAHPLRATLRVVGAAFLIAGERWAEAHGEPTDHLYAQLPTQLVAGAGDLELRRAADKFLTGGPSLDTTQVHLNEQRLIACLATHPTAIGPTHAWLSPGRLTNRPWATVYAALGEMSDAGQWIDPVTLAMRTLRVAQQTRTAPSLSGLLNAVEAERSSVPGHLRQTVAGDQLRLLAQQGAQALRAGAANTGTRVVDLLDTATVLVQALSHIATALPDHAGHQGSLSHLPNRGIGHAGPGQEHREGPVAG